jgi:hypothetical protein
MQAKAQRSLSWPCGRASGGMMAFTDLGDGVTNQGRKDPELVYGIGGG